MVDRNALSARSKTAGRIQSSYPEHTAFDYRPVREDPATAALLALCASASPTAQLDPCTAAGVNSSNDCCECKQTY
ncbi:unnamed protein product [Zymoseptoria tritici ST99CH_1E4]|uniref:Uncharacterized protein n=1 Tax=Zymoseptoria tritici ST99CH_1E4 TaxID=1276532 RepID=A0A2H1H3U7_ZYMTR|nr:unnamed protein product [Zymoseptoria tritici ST99CH_1E4]